MKFGLMFLLGLAVQAQGQMLHATGDRPSFEVASIRPWKRTPSPPPSDGAAALVKVMKESPVGGGGQTTDRVHMIMPVALLIASAYNLPAGSEGRLIQGPDWIQSNIDQYEVQAKIEAQLYAAMQKMTASQQREQVALMEQSLLADRFGMKAHFAMKEIPVYVLVVAKGGPKLTTAKDGESSRLSSPGDELAPEMTATAITLDQFVLSPLLTGSAEGRPVVNQTGLKGAFDFTLKWGSEQFLTSAIREQLGLQFVPSKAQVEVLIIDHIEPPSPN